jgi:ParB family transcriptional regulator, chromosome partitioning protein
MKKGGLGQGLAALLGPQALPEGSKSVERRSDSALQEIPMELIYPNEEQPRGFFNYNEIEALAQSIQQNGLLQPILVRQMEDDTYQIIAGERRWRAAQLLEMKTLPAIVRDMTDEEVMLSALVENLQREDLNPIEEARTYATILEKMKITHAELGVMVGKSRSHISNLCRLLALPKSVGLLVTRGDLTVGHARTLIKKENCEEIALLMYEKKISVREAEKLMREKEGKEPKGPVQKESPVKTYAPESDGVVSQEEKDEINRIESFLKDRLGHPVKIYIHKDTTDVVFHLPSRENLDDLLAKLNTIAP